MVSSFSSLPSSPHSFVWDPSIPGYRSQGKGYATEEEAREDAERFAHKEGLAEQLGKKNLDMNIEPIEFRGKWQVTLLIPKNLAPIADSTTKAASSTFDFTKATPFDTSMITSEFMTFEDLGNLMLAKDLERTTKTGQTGVRDPEFDQIAVKFCKKKSAELEQLKLKTIEHLVSCQTMLNEVPFEIVIQRPLTAVETIALHFKMERAEQFLAGRIEELRALTTNLVQEAEGESTFKLFEHAYTLYKAKRELLFETTMQNLTETLALNPAPNEARRSGDFCYEIIWDKTFDHLLRDGGTELALNFLNIYLQFFVSQIDKVQMIEVKIHSPFNNMVPRVSSNDVAVRLAAWNSLIKIMKERPGNSDIANAFERMINDLCFRSVPTPPELPKENSLEVLNRIKELALTLNNEDRTALILRNTAHAYAKCNPPQMKSVDEIISILRNIGKEKSVFVLKVHESLLRELTEDTYKKYSHLPHELKKILEGSPLSSKSAVKFAYQKALKELQKNIDTMNDLWEMKQIRVKVGLQVGYKEIPYPKKSFFEIQEALEKLKSNDTIMKELMVDLRSNLSQKEFIDEFPNIIRSGSVEDSLPLLDYISFVAPPGQEIELKRKLFMKLIDTYLTVEFSPSTIRMFTEILQKGKMYDEFRDGDLVLKFREENSALIEKKVAEALKKCLKNAETFKNRQEMFKSFCKQINSQRIKAELSVAWIECMVPILVEEKSSEYQYLTKRNKKLNFEENNRLILKEIAESIPPQIVDERGNLLAYAMQLVQKLNRDAQD